MSLRSCFVFIAMFLSLSSLGCGGDPPDKEIQQARGAIAAARAAGAETYAVGELAAAETALKNADAAVEQRDYRQALNHALDSREQAETAAKAAADNKAAARVAADHVVTAALAAVSAAEDRLKAGDVARTSSHALADAVADAQRRVQEAGTAFDRGDYAAATASASAAVEGLKPFASAIEPTGVRRRPTGR